MIGKYVILSDGTPILFPGNPKIKHSDTKPLGRAVAAGTFLISAIGSKLRVTVTGQSDTLTIVSRPRDAEIIAKEMGIDP